MAANATLDIIIQLQGDAEKQLQHLAKDVDDVGAKASKSGGILKGIGGIMGTLGKVAAGAAAGGVGALGAALVSGIGDARDAAKIFAQSEAVIKGTGGAAGVSAQQVADYASSLSAASGKSLFGDDQIAESENLLLTFTNIKGKSLEAATSMSVDLAQAMGGAPKDAAIQLGKALNDPIAGVGALSRIGVTFDDQQKKQIKTYMDAGNAAAAQGVILKELSKEFGGSAQAAATADGGMAQFKDRMGELAESIGGKVLPLLNSLLAWLNSDGVQAGIQGMADALVNGVGAAFNWLTGTALPALSSFWDDVIGAWQEGDGGGDGAGGVIQTVLYAVGQLIPALQPPIEFIRDHFWPVWEAGSHIIAIVRDAIITFVQALNGDWVNASGIMPFHAAVGELGLFIRNILIPAIIQTAQTIISIGAATADVIHWIQEHTVVQSVLIGVLTSVVTAIGLAKAAALAHTIAVNAVNIATGIWTGAQWLLNAALTANPIGIVIVALAGLTAGLMYAYNNSETFRNAVNAVAVVFAGAFDSAVRGANIVLDAMSKSFADVQRAISSVIGWVQSLGDKLSNIHMPDWLVQHSPSPFEQSLMDVGVQMGAIAKNHIPTLQSALDGMRPPNLAAQLALIPAKQRLGSGSAGLSPAAGASPSMASGGGGSSIVVNINNPTVDSAGRVSDLKQVIIDTVGRLLNGEVDALYAQGSIGA